jgi:hypothetical protein
VAEIRGSRELGGSLGESPKLGCLKLREARSRSVEVAPKRHVAEPQGGPGRGPADTRHTFGGVNIC